MIFNFLFIGLIFWSSFTYAKDNTDTIFPILKEKSWPAKEHVLNSALFGIESSNIPLVAYAYDKQEGFQYITKFDENLDFKTIQESAVDNLCSRSYELTAMSEKTLTASGDIFSSEMILCSNFLDEAHQRLGTDKIWVFIPRRTVIYIAAANMGQKEQKEFIYISMYTLLDDSYGNPVISDTFYEFKNSKLTGMFSVAK